MISLTAPVLLIIMPLWSVTDPTPWHEQEVEIITVEPRIEDIERNLERRRYRIMRVEDIGP